MRPSPDLPAHLQSVVALMAEAPADGPDPGAGSVVLRALAGLPPGWIALRGCDLPPMTEVQEPVRLPLALLHPAFGIVLVEFGATETPAAASRLRLRLAGAGLAAAEQIPVLHLRLPTDQAGRLGRALAHALEQRKASGPVLDAAWLPPVLDLLRDWPPVIAARRRPPLPVPPPPETPPAGPARDRRGIAWGAAALAGAGVVAAGVVFAWPERGPVAKPAQMANEMAAQDPPVAQPPLVLASMPEPAAESGADIPALPVGAVPAIDPAPPTATAGLTAPWTLPPALEAPPAPLPAEGVVPAKMLPGLVTLVAALPPPVVPPWPDAGAAAPPLPGPMPAAGALPAPMVPPQLDVELAAPPVASLPGLIPAAEALPPPVIPPWPETQAAMLQAAALPEAIAAAEARPPSLIPPWPEAETPRLPEAMPAAAPLPPPLLPARPEVQVAALPEAMPATAALPPPVIPPRPEAQAAPLPEAMPATAALPPPVIPPRPEAQAALLPEAMPAAEPLSPPATASRPEAQAAPLPVAMPATGPLSPPATAPRPEAQAAPLPVAMPPAEPLPPTVVAPRPAMQVAEAPPPVIPPRHLPGPPAAQAGAPPAVASAPPAEDPPAARPVAAPMAPVMIAALLRRGDQMLAIGDISAARLLYERAASGGSGAAALALGRTHDPDILARLGVRGPLADRAAALAWYRRAAALGEPEAEVLLRAADAR